MRQAGAIDRGTLPAALALAASLVLGGRGSPAPWPELILQLILAALFAWWLVRAPEARSAVPLPVWVIAALIGGLHLAQLIPLPPAAWHALPGRDNTQAALDLIGQSDSWRPLSLTPARTLASLLAACAALACLVMTSALDHAGRWRLIAVAAGIGIAMLLVGAAQLSGGPGSLLRFHDPHSPFLLGFQANHNSAADVILVTMLALAAIARHWLDRQVRQPAPALFLLTALVANAAMAVGLFLTGSRAGLLLLAPVLGAQALILYRGPGIIAQRLGASIIATAALGAIAAFALRANRTVGTVLARFKLEGEFRPELWRDAGHALGQHWPAGSGQGSFAPVMMAIERLEVIDPTLPHRAHNDYLELAVEGGLPGLAVLGAVAAMMGVAGWRALRREPAAARPKALFALAVLSVFILHSLIDYPLRSMALAALAAVAAGLLYPARPCGLGRPGESHP